MLTFRNRLDKQILNNPKHTVAHSTTDPGSDPPLISIVDSLRAINERERANALANFPIFGAERRKPPRFSKNGNGALFAAV